MAIWFVNGGGGGGNGITGKVASKPRVHATAQDWGNGAPITDFWFDPGNGDIITASIPSLLAAQYGWISAGTLSVVAGSGADFLGGTGATVDDGTPNHLLVNTSGERLTSPFVFGSHSKTRFITNQLGWTPSRLIAEGNVIWTTSSNADTTGGVGFVEAGGAIQTAADHLAMITSDATDFILRSGAATSTSTLTVDTVAHFFKIVIDKGQQLVFGYLDGVSIGSIALETDLFPAAFGVATTSSNALGLGATHIYYD